MDEYSLMMRNYDHYDEEREEIGGYPSEEDYDVTQLNYDEYEWFFYDN